MACSSSSFSQQAEIRKIKPETIAKLIKEQFDNVDSFVLLDEDTMRELGFKAGQRGLITKWINEIKTATSGSQNPVILKLMGANQNEFECITFFKEVAKEGHLNENTLDSLLEEEYDSFTALDPLVDADLDKLRLTKGQAALVKQFKYHVETALEMRSERQDNEGGQTETDQSEPDEEQPPTPEEVTACFKELNIKGPEKEEVERRIKEKGVDGLKEYLDAQITDFMTTPVTIAVTGRSGTGKSSLINTLRNLRPGDPDAAKVGVTETTMRVQQYSHTQMKNVHLLDLPGVNTPNFPRETYLDKVKFEAYDAFIITSTERFTEDDFWLAIKAHALGSPFYLLRTKIDQTLENAKRDSPEKTETQVLGDIRKSIQSGLKKGGLPGDRVFLVSSIYENQIKWDFPHLVRELISKTPAKNQKAMVLAMITCSRDVIEKKVEELRIRIKIITAESVLCKDADQYLKSEIQLYTERLGITKTDMKDLNTSTFSANLKGTIKALDKIKNHDMKEWKAFRRVGIAFLGFGYFIGRAIDRKKTANAKVEGEKAIKEKLDKVQELLNTVLSKCEELALAVVDAKQYLSAPSDRNVTRK